MGQRKRRLFSGMRPTGKLHLGHLVGALQNWVRLQDECDCIFSITDWHALMGEYEDAGRMPEYIHDMALDWLACGLDPQRSIIFVQSHVPQHLELQMFFSCLTPLGWLERNPTYKEQLREIKTRDLQTYGFLGYPVLQAADILLYKATAVPVGEDQIPHLELAREIARRFNFIYHANVFEDCDAILTPTPRLLGLDGRKMSKSYDNAINLSDAKDDIDKKVSQMITDPQRIRLMDVGHPDCCNVFAYYQIFCAEQIGEVRAWCEGAAKGCTECKKILAAKIDAHIAPIRERRIAFEKNSGFVDDVLAEGGRKAKAIADETMDAVREAVFQRKK